MTHPDTQKIQTETPTAFFILRVVGAVTFRCVTCLLEVENEEVCDRRYGQPGTFPFLISAGRALMGSMVFDADTHDLIGRFTCEGGCGG